MRPNINSDSLNRLFHVLVVVALATGLSQAQSLPDDCGTAREEIAKLQDWVTFNQDQIRGLAFIETNDKIKEWKALGDAAKQKVISSALEATFTVLTAGVLAQMKFGDVTLKNGLASLNPPKTQQIVGKLKALGLDDPILADAIRAIGAASNKKPAIENAVRSLTAAKDVYMASHADSDTGALEGLATFIETAADLYGPGLAITADTAKVAVNSISAYSQGRLINSSPQSVINQLTDLNQTKLQQLSQMTRLLKINVDKLKRAKARLVALSCNDPIIGRWQVTWDVGVADGTGILEIGPDYLAKWTCQHMRLENYAGQLTERGCGSSSPFGCYDAGTARISYVPFSSVLNGIYTMSEKQRCLNNWTEKVRIAVIGDRLSGRQDNGDGYIKSFSGSRLK